MTETRAVEAADRPGLLLKTSLGDVHVVVDGDPSAPLSGRSGAGAAAVACVHGVPGGTRDFRAFAAVAREHGLCVVRIDLPGFGRSPPVPAEQLRTAQQRAALVVEVMRARGHARFAVVGHSFGGTTALATAALHPSVVTAVVLVNSVGITRHRGLQAPHELIGQAKRLAQVPVVGERMLETLLSTYARLGLKSEKPLTKDDVLAHTEIIGGLDYADLRAFAALVRCPALVVSAADDRLVEPAVSFALAQALSTTALTTHRHRQSGGHFLQKHEAPAIAAWLAARLGER